MTFADGFSCMEKNLIFAPNVRVLLFFLSSINEILEYHSNMIHEAVTLLFKMEWTFFRVCEWEFVFVFEIFPIGICQKLKF